MNPSVAQLYDLHRRSMGAIYMAYPNGGSLAEASACLRVLAIGKEGRWIFFRLESALLTETTVSSQRLTSHSQVNFF